MCNESMSTSAANSRWRSVSCISAPLAEFFASSVHAESTSTSSAATTAESLRASHPGGKSESCWMQSA